MSPWLVQGVYFNGALTVGDAEGDADGDLDGSGAGLSVGFICQRVSVK